jgi:hypothetical protein
VRFTSDRSLAASLRAMDPATQTARIRWATQ